MAGKEKGSFWKDLDKDGDGMVIDDILESLGSAFRFHTIHRRDIREEWDEIINNTLASIRTLLPGVSVLLGFLISLPFTTVFQQMALTDQLWFYVAFYLAALTLVFLLTPGIYYRIVHPFEDRKVFINFATKVLILAMVPLAGCLLIVVAVVTRLVLPSDLEHRDILSGMFIGTFFLLYLVVWLKSMVDRKKFYTLRRQHEREEREQWMEYNRRRRARGLPRIPPPWERRKMEERNNVCEAPPDDLYAPLPEHTDAPGTYGPSQRGRDGTGGPSRRPAGGEYGMPSGGWAAGRARGRSRGRSTGPSTGPSGGRMRRKRPPEF